MSKPEDGSKYQQKIARKFAKGKPEPNWMWWMERAEDRQQRLKGKGAHDDRDAERAEATA